MNRKRAQKELELKKMKQNNDNNNRKRVQTIPTPSNIVEIINITTVCQRDSSAEGDGHHRRLLSVCLFECHRKEKEEKNSTIIINIIDEMK